MLELTDPLGNLVEPPPPLMLEILPVQQLRARLREVQVAAPGERDDRCRVALGHEFGAAEHVIRHVKRGVELHRLLERSDGSIEGLHLEMPQPSLIRLPRPLTRDVAHGLLPLRKDGRTGQQGNRHRAVKKTDQPGPPLSCLETAGNLSA